MQARCATWPRKADMGFEKEIDAVRMEEWTAMYIDYAEFKLILHGMCALPRPLSEQKLRAGFHSNNNHRCCAEEALCQAAILQVLAREFGSEPPILYSCNLHLRRF